MKPMIVSLFEDYPAVQVIADAKGYDIGHVLLRDFPDGESYIQFQDDLNHRDLILFTSLDRPNAKILPLILVAETAKALGARRVGLCAPYLAYMRQDKQFHSGEGVTSAYFAKLLSQYIDWLVTVDPHLHRYHDLDEIYSMPSTVLHARKAISHWIEQKVVKPLLIGPDGESEQWVAEVARLAHAPYLVLEKSRRGDYDVDISSPALEPYLAHTPVLVDDIISTAQTMLGVVKYLQQASMSSAICVGIHAVFAEHAYEALVSAGVANIATCNTIQHKSNCIDVSSILSDGIARQLVQPPKRR